MRRRACARRFPAAASRSSATTPSRRSTPRASPPRARPRPSRVHTIPAGEASKTRKSWSRLTDELLDAGFGRDSAIIALGGGVVGDLAGFVAATYMRGIPFVQVPTSLLAMIDASIGGKTGVDTRAGKNLVGAFHHPALVIVDPLALATLPARAHAERARRGDQARRHREPRGVRLDRGEPRRAAARRAARDAALAERLVR